MSMCQRFMEAFWGYLWHTVVHSGSPPREDDVWDRAKFSGLKLFVHHIVSVVGNDHFKPATECCRGMTYPRGDMVQGRYSMLVTDLGNRQYTHAINEALPLFSVGRSEKSELIGDPIECC